MAVNVLGGIEIEVDEGGFIQEPEKWTIAVAEDLAKEEASASPMSEDHWRVIDYIREYYLDFDTAPAIRMLCNKTRTRLENVYELFPNGPIGACKMAGLPNPAGCV